MRARGREGRSKSPRSAYPGNGPGPYAQKRRNQKGNIPQLK
nr:MAG TPA: hypothetical protein [Caudoviricetes sp.]